VTHDPGAQFAEAAVMAQRLAEARPKPIGVASGLHRYLHSQCHTTGAESGTVPGYAHVDAAVHLGVTSRQIRQWMRSLVARGHVTWVRQGNHLTVSIPGYVARTTASKGTQDAR